MDAGTLTSISKYSSLVPEGLDQLGDVVKRHDKWF